MVKTLDKQITISHAQRADAPQGKIFKLQEYQKKRINKWIGSDSLEHYGDETQYIVEAIADTIDGFGSSSECPVQRNPYPIFLFRQCLSFYPCL